MRLNRRHRSLVFRFLSSGLVVSILIARVLLCFRFRFKEVVDLLGAHSTEAVVDEHAIGQAEAGVDQQGIDGEVTRLVPSLRIASRAAHMMVQGRVHDLVSQGSGQSRRVQGFNKIRVVEERHAIRGHRLNRPALAPFQSEQERAEERMVQDERGARLLNTQ